MMAKRSNVPKFGDWENEADVPYTVYFEKARKNRGTDKVIHTEPNDRAYTLRNNSAQSQEPIFVKEQKIQKGADVVPPNKPTEPSSVASYDQRQGRVGSPGGNKAESEFQRNWEKSGSNNEQRYIREDGSQRRPNDPRLHSEAAGHGKAMRQVAAGSEHGFEGSALHRNQQAKVGTGGNGVSSHSWEGKALYQGSTGHGSAPFTPGRSRLKPLSHNSDDLDYDSAVPKFGGWNESNPDSGEGYTEKFNKVLKERRDGAVIAPSPVNHSRQVGNESPQKKCCCFPWGR